MSSSSSIQYTAEFLNRAEIDILLDLIYMSQNLKFKPDEIKFGTPLLLDQRPDILTDENTFVPIVVDASVDSRFTPDNQTDGFMYRRIPFDELTPPAGPITVAAFPINTYSLLTQINNQYGLQLSEKDVVNIEYQNNGDYVLEAAPESLVWTGSLMLDLMLQGSDFQGLRLTEDTLDYRVTEDGTTRAYLVA